MYPEIASADRFKLTKKCTGFRNYTRVGRQLDMQRKGKTRKGLAHGVVNFVLVTKGVDTPDFETIQ